ncbi:MAG TPA: hypothetical protein VFM82_08490 [Flavobacteriaceae bacterium]|nr:hypothetical protein [Flavobacteriaceae bacterium]
MSRSKNKTKMHGNTTAISEKEDKRKANRKLRKIVKQRLKSQHTEFPRLREVSNIWSFQKDGKKYDASMTEKDLRK